MNTSDKVKLNLGCGLQCPDGWINIDSSMGARLSKFPTLTKVLHSVIPHSWGILPNVNWPSNVKWMDITRRFPFESDSVDCIYSSHTFEHLTYSEASYVLSECNRVLKPRGVIRIIVPDLEQMIDNYLLNKQKIPHLAAKKLMDDSLYFEIPIPDTIKGLMKFYFKKKNNHHFLYDHSGLTYQLEQVGFDGIQSMPYGESKIEDIIDIDIASRFSGAICLEGVKFH